MTEIAPGLGSLNLYLRVQLIYKHWHLGVVRFCFQFANQVGITTVMQDLEQSQHLRLMSDSTREKRVSGVAKVPMSQEEIFDC